MTVTSRFLHTETFVGSSESGGNARVPGYSAFGTARPYGNLVRSQSQQILTKSSACRTAFRTQYKREVRGSLGVTFCQNSARF